MSSNVALSELAMLDRHRLRWLGKRMLQLIRLQRLDALENWSSFEFRQLRRTEHRVVADQQRRIDLLIPMLARMHVEHDLPERALHARQRALQHHEPRA